MLDWHSCQICYPLEKKNTRTFIMFGLSDVRSRRYTRVFYVNIALYLLDALLCVCVPFPF